MMHSSELDDSNTHGSKRHADVGITIMCEKNICGLTRELYQSNTHTCSLNIIMDMKANDIILVEIKVKTLTKNILIEREYFL